MSDPQKKYVFNGIDGSTGKYSTPPMTIGQIAEIARASFEPPTDKQKKWFERRRKVGFFKPLAELDPKRLDEVGWGVIFPHDCDPAIVEALAPLLEHREKAAGKLFRSMKKGDGYRPGETNLDFLARHDYATSSGPVDPELMPYYLLLVGGPDRIPYAFQYQLDVNYAVGRIALDTPEEYANYARSVVEAETRGVSRSKTMRFFGVRNEDDEATQSSADLLVGPLFESTRKLNAKKAFGWNIEKCMAEQATKANLAKSLTEPEGPAFLFTASHGMGYDFGDPKQAPFQGSLLCQDWPGPYGWSGEIPEKFLLAGSDLGNDADVHGLISFHFACFGAGTPEFDDYVRKSNAGRPRIAESPFVGALPRRLLSHPRGGALACVGHIERAWTFSFTLGEGDQSITHFRDAVNQLLLGFPIGHAMESLNSRFADVAAHFTSLLYEDQFAEDDARLDPETLALKWIEHNDARSYVILGDPFVRLVPESLGKPAGKHETLIENMTGPNRSGAGREPEIHEISGKSGDPGDSPKGKSKKTPKNSKTSGETPPQNPEVKSLVGSGDGPGGFTDISNYTFVEPESGCRATITALPGMVDPSFPFQAAWEHIATAARLLGAREIVMGESVTDDDGRTTLTASFVAGEGDEIVRQHYGIVRDPSGRCLEVRLLAPPDDASAPGKLAKILADASFSGKSRPFEFSVASKKTDPAFRSEPVGPFAVTVPAGFRLQGTRRFLAGDGRSTIEIDFGDSAAAAAAKPFGLPSIGVRSQFGKVEEVPRFLRSPIRFETPVFPRVGPQAGATAFAVPDSPEKADESRPLYSKTVEIGGRKASVRCFGEDMDAATAKAVTEEFLETLE